MHRAGLRTSEQLTDAAVGFHQGEPWKVGPGGNRGGEEVSPQRNDYYKCIGVFSQCPNWPPRRAATFTPLFVAEKRQRM